MSEIPSKWSEPAIRVLMMPRDTNAHGTILHPEARRRRRISGIPIEGAPLLLRCAQDLEAA